ncbi:MAG TPA: hypothetical protein VFS43_44535 [Polyangiaceae bacterium]|nr:hypothetical protein [Polyangiaceae bacterium]
MKTKTLGLHGLRALFVSTLLTGCASTTIEQRRVESPARVRLVHPEPEASLGGEFRYEAGAVVGALAWQNACRREEVREVETQKVAVTPLLDKPVSYALVAVGAAAIIGGIYAIANAGDGEHADYRRCDDRSNDECKSPRELMTQAGIGLIISGLGFGSYGVAGLAAKPRVAPVGAPSVEQKVRTVEPDVACGKPRALGGITLSISPPGAEPVSGTTDAEGALRIELGPGALVPGGARVPVEISEVPEALAEVIPSGTVVGEVSLPAPAPVEGPTRGRGGAQRAKGRGTAGRERSATR